MSQFLKRGDEGLFYPERAPRKFGSKKTSSPGGKSSIAFGENNIPAKVKPSGRKPPGGVTSICLGISDVCSSMDNLPKADAVKFVQEPSYGNDFVPTEEDAMSCNGSTDSLQLSALPTELHVSHVAVISTPNLLETVAMTAEIPSSGYSDSSTCAASDTASNSDHGNQLSPMLATSSLFSPQYPRVRHISFVPTTPGDRRMKELIFANEYMDIPKSQKASPTKRNADSKELFGTSSEFLSLPEAAGVSSGKHSPNEKSKVAALINGSDNKINETLNTRGTSVFRNSRNIFCLEQEVKPGRRNFQNANNSFDLHATLVESEPLPKQNSHHSNRSHVGSSSISIN